MITTENPMWFRSLFDSLMSRSSRTPARRNGLNPKRQRAAGARLQVEALEDRCLPSTFTVLNLLDNGPDSLRAAVVAANDNPGADAIDFATAGTIALTSGELDITDSLTINGPGADALTVSGENNSRVFAIAGNPTVLIAGLTVANGWTYGSPGGGIAMAGGTLTLDHVSVTGNLAVGVEGESGGGAGGYGAGGGLFVAAGTVTLNQCTVTGNAALGGTGADGYGVSGGGGGTGSGGGLWVQGGMVQINQSIFSGNLAAGGNGGAGQSIYEVTTYGGNGGLADGGGIRVWGGSVQIHQSSIFDNVAVGGSGGLGTWYDEFGVFGGYWYGDPGWSGGGGLTIDTAAPPLVDLDTYTESNTVNNYADYEPNIWGPYSLNGVWVPPLTISDVSRLEGNSDTTTFVFTVSIPAAISQTVSVNYATADGSATAADNDYQPQSGTLTFAPGEISKTVTVQVNGDRLAEPVETFFVNLTEPTNAVITDAQGVGTHRERRAAHQHRRRDHDGGQHRHDAVRLQREPLGALRRPGDG
jgi:Calx-beta domain